MPKASITNQRYAYINKVVTAAVHKQGPRREHDRIG